jgi:hypothetical protein
MSCLETGPSGDCRNGPPCRGRLYLSKDGQGVGRSATGGVAQIFALIMGAEDIDLLPILLPQRFKLRDARLAVAGVRLKSDLKRQSRRRCEEVDGPVEIGIACVETPFLTVAESDAAMALGMAGKGDELRVENAR